MDDATRSQLKQGLDELDRAEDGLRKARRPFDDAIAAVASIRERLLEKHSVEIAGTCEGCNRLLFYGEKGFSYEDGPIVCEACSPTYSDVAEHWASHDEDEDGRKAAFTAQMEAHLAAGGSATDKLPLAAF